MRLSAGQLDRARELHRAGRFFWLDLEDPDPALMARVGEGLGLHALAIEDTLEWGQRPKLDPYRDHLLLVFYSARIDEVGRAEPVELHLHVSGSWALTVRREPCPALDAAESLPAADAAPGGAAAPEDEDPAAHTEGALVTTILDALTDGYEPVISAFERRLDALEDEVLTQVHDAQLERVYRLRQEVHAIERRVAAQHDAFPATIEALSSLPGLEWDNRMRLRDVGDHLTHAAGELRRQGADLQALTDTYFNANANRLNRQATRLSVVATFFLVWTLVTGFFGQNFGWLTGSIESPVDFLVLGVGGLALPTVVLGIYFWRRRSDFT